VAARICIVCTCAANSCQELSRLKIPEILQPRPLRFPGRLASVLNVIAEAGLVLEDVTSVRRERGRTSRAACTKNSWPRLQLQRFLADSPRLAMGGRYSE
jgi:hypothetical protein